MNKPALKVAETAPAQPQPHKTKLGPLPKKKRHWVIRASFLFVVLLPTVAAAVYLWTRAADQFHSQAAFSVRSEEFTNPLEAFGAFTQIGQSSSPDAEILYDFVRSQPLVQAINEEIDLATIYRKNPDDLVFSLKEDASIEDLVAYWERMVRVSNDPANGLLELEVRAFDPEDAVLVADKILELGATLVEDLSRVAREDATRFAEVDVTEAEERLREIRRDVRVFRTENQIIDPEADVESRMGVMSALQARLAEVLIERSTILTFADADDLRIRNLDTQIQAIREQLEVERQSFSTQAGGQLPLTQVIGEYEELLVDLEFSQNAYTAALAAEEQARAEARRQSRYLAVHIPPTQAQDSLFPQRELLVLLVFVCLFAFWATSVLIYYNVRDRS